MSDIVNNMANNAVEDMSPLVARVRAYFAPVDRVNKHAAVFDPAQTGAFALDDPSAPWVDLGWITDFKRRCDTKFSSVKMGAPAATYLQARTEIEAAVSFSFQSWGKLQLSLSAGTQQMNVLKTTTGASAGDSGGPAVAATPLAAGSTATVLQMGATAAASFTVGEWVAVDVDYTGQTGFIGSGISAAFVKAALTDVDYVRRVTLNVGVITSISEGALTLRQPLPAGAPTSAMKVSSIVGFCDREGSTFFQEWSALFVGEGAQGERVVWFYPRLQTSAGIAENDTASPGGYRKLMLSGVFRALPVKDPVDGESVVCFRSYSAA